MIGILRELAARRPFRLILLDGRELAVAEPKLVSFGLYTGGGVTIDTIDVVTPDGRRHAVPAGMVAEVRIAEPAGEGGGG